MTNRTHILRPLLGALLAAAILLPASSPAFPGKEGAAPPMGGGGHGKGAPAMGGDSSAAREASKAASEPPPGSAPEPVDPSDAVELPAVVAKVDGVEYGAPLFRSYVRDILQKRPRTREEFFPLLQQFALDAAAAPDVLAANPALDNDPVVLHEVAKVRARVYPRAFFSHEIEGKVKPTDEELLALAPPFSVRYDVRVISADKYGSDGTAGLPGALAKIDAAEKALASGVPFEKVAADRKYSDALSSEKAGRLVTLTEENPSPFNHEEFEHFRHVPAGKTSPVFPTRLGYALVLVEKVASVEEQRAEDLKRNRVRYLGELQKREYERRYDALVAQAKIEWNEPVLEKVRVALDNGDSLRPFAGEVLVRVNGTAILGRDLADVSALHGGNVVDIHLDKRVRTEIVGQEVERLGVAGPLAPVLDLAKRRAVVRRHFDLRREGIRAGDAELRDFYEKNKGRFQYEEQRRLLIVETADAKKAKDVAKQGRKGKDFGALAGKHNDNPEARKAKGHAGLLGRKQLPAALADKVFSAAAGEVIGPLETADRGTGKKVWAVIKVEEVLPAETRPYDSLKREILLDKYLANQMETLNREFLEAAERRHTVELMMKPDGGRGNDEKKG